MGEETGKNRMYLSILLDKTLIDEIDDFRFKERFLSRTEAIRWLLEHALKQKLKRAAAKKAKG